MSASGFKWLADVRVKKQLKILMIGAHFDDNDFRGGGTALKYIMEGHTVRFLVVCDGTMGHHEMAHGDIRKRRMEEAANVSAITGIEYDNMGLPECDFEADRENRKWMVRYIREYQHEEGMTIRSNFYKCGNMTQFPHHGIWNLMPLEKLDFHQPEYFGEIMVTIQDTP